MITVYQTLAKGVVTTTRLAGVLNIELPSQLWKFEGLLEKIDKTEKNSGSKSALLLWKYWYDCITQMVMQEFEYPKPPIFSRLYPDGFPKDLWRMRQIILANKDNVKLLRILMTVFRSSDAVKLPREPDLKSIIEPSRGESNFKAIDQVSFQDFLNRSPLAAMVKKDFERYRSKLLREKIYFHFSSKSGISGPTLASIHTQALYFVSDWNLSNKICKLSSFFYKEDLKDLIKRSQDHIISKGLKDLNVKANFCKILSHPGKLSFLEQGGGKTRCIAIGNYWVQNALYPLHKLMYKCLRHIAADGTYDQCTQSSRVANATLKQPVWSFDLSKATDRLPLLPQIMTMEFLNNSIGKTWKEVIQAMNFEYEGVKYKYQVGQPMGLYTSWASLALTHHFLICYCAYKVGIEDFTSYSVLGDDVAIWNKEVAGEYKELITRLDVDISVAKSYIPKDNAPPFKGEFAKRLFKSGVEYSGFSPNVVREGLSSFWSFPELASFLIRHNFPVSVDTALISRASKFFGLSKEQQKKLFLAFSINSNLGAPYGVTVGHELEDLEEVTIAKLIDNRLDLLTKSAASLFEEIDSRQDLEHILGTNDCENLGFERVIQDRVSEAELLEKRMIKYIPSEEWLGREQEFFNQVKASDETEYEDHILTKIKDVELLPALGLNNIMACINNHKDKKTLRTEFLKRLVNHYLSSSMPQASDEDDW
jgi:hypothetical protein